MHPFEYFSAQDVERIHAGSLRVLETVGLDFLYEPAARLFSRAGCRVDGSRVFFPPKLVEEQVAKAPSEFTLFARNPAKNVTIGGDHIAFVPCYGAPVVSNLDEGRRDSTLGDFTNFVKLTHASLYQDITGGIMAEPNDIPLERRTAEMVYSSIRYSDKPFMGGSLGERSANDTIAAAAIVFGSGEELAKRPPFVSILTSFSPLAYDDRMLSAMMAYAQAGLPQLISSLVISGATGPVTMEGTLVVQNAEVLAGITLAQLVREGTPVIYGGQSTGAAMRYGTLSIGAPEMAVNTAATAQMARFYGLPSRSGGALTDSKTCDSQSGFESMMNQLMATISGINFVLHSAGILESYMVASYEKFILDDEICGMCKRILRGEYLTDERLAVDLICGVGPGGEYLTNTHTFANFRKELYQPIIEERSNFGNWVKSGALSIENKANAKWKAILENYVEPELPKDLERDLRKYVDGK